MKFIDLNIQQVLIRDKINENIKNVLDHGQYILGPEVDELEKQLSQYVGVKHCIGVSSGTDALLIAMLALDIAPGDEVITPAFNYVATAEVAKLIGAVPVYIDIDPLTYNINPELILKKITNKTKVIIPTSLYGQCADMDAINQLSDRYGLPVIEDGAQSFGASYKSRRSCSLSTIGVTSFFPTKPLGAYGDGGAIFTDDDDLAILIRQISRHGQDYKYHHIRVGVNGRLDTLQAAVLLAKLDLFDKEVEEREKLGKKYSDMLNESGIKTTPYIEPHNRSVYAQYTIRIKNRDKVIKLLKKNGIPTAIHYPMPLHLQPSVNDPESNVPESVSASKEVLSLPFYPYLTDGEIEEIANKLRDSIFNTL